MAKRKVTVRRGSGGFELRYTGGRDKAVLTSEELGELGDALIELHNGDRPEIKMELSLYEVPDETGDGDGGTVPQAERVRGGKKA